MKNHFYVWLLLLMFGCKSNDTGTNLQSSEYSGTIQISVSAGTTPVFNWAPPEKINFLNIEPDSSGADQWNIISDSTNAISPPVTYGVVPEGAIARRPPQILVQGVKYNVYLFQRTGPGSQNSKLIGK